MSVVSSFSCTFAHDVSSVGRQQTTCKQTSSYPSSIPTSAARLTENFSDLLRMDAKDTVETLNFKLQKCKLGIFDQESS